MDKLLIEINFSQMEFTFHHQTQHIEWFSLENY